MEIAGFIKNSFIDFPGVIASVVFTPFCNMRCWYCHNQEILSQVKGTVKEQEVFKHLISRKNLIDGVVITGGEPTFQKDLMAFIKKIKAMGFKVKLDTNGTNLEVVKSLVNENLLDYIAMDIKAPLSRYKQIIGVELKGELILNSINYLKECGVEYEFRTTFSPDLTKEDIIEIARLAGKNSNYAIQQYVKNSSSAPDPLKEQFIIEVASEAKKYVKKLSLRGLRTNI